MREMASSGIFQLKSASRERGQFWQETATDRIIKIFNNTSHFLGLIYENNEEIK